MRCLLTLLLFPVLLPADVPAQEIPPVKVILETPATENGRNAWMTPRFRIDADTSIGVETVRKLAILGESTAAVLSAYPLPLSAPPEKSKLRISLYADALAYENAGAAKGSAGYYSGKGDPRVMIRADYFLSAVVVERSRLTPDMDEDLAVHELVHLCMHRKFTGLPQWFAEGIAEYFSCAHRGGGRFSFSRMDDAVRDHLRVKLSPRNPAIRLLPVASISALDDKEWLELMKSLPAEERFLAYGTALLLTHYHLHGGPERLDRVRVMLEKADRQRKPEPFLGQDGGPVIEAALIRFWQTKGLTLRFANASPRAITR
ncbi:MAG: hypothetical protein V4819_21605 [Verrucomicrobiota bacterium]